MREIKNVLKSDLDHCLQKKNERNVKVNDFSYNFANV